MMEISRKLRAIQNLKDMLVKSENATKSMVKILNEFDDRLKKLETAVTPIYKESGNLQMRLKNSEALLQNLEHVMEFYNTAKQAQSIIEQNNMIGGLDEYLTCMDKIVASKEFFVDNSITCPELHQIKQLYDKGLKCLEREYHNMLLQQSRPVAPHIIMDLMNTEQDISSDTALSISTLPSTVVDDLRKLSLWLSVNSESPDFMSTYSSIRGDTLLASLKGLRDHVRSQSGSGSSLSTPSSMLSAYKSFPTESSYNAIRNLKRKFFGKNSSAGMSGSGGPNSLITKYASNNASGFLSHNSDNQSSSNSADVEVEIYLTSLHALLKLMQVEERVMSLVIPESLFWQIYGELIQRSLDTVLTEGESIVSAVKSAVRAQDFTPALSVFPIFKYMQGLRPSYDSILIYCKPVTKQKFDSLMDHMTEASYTLLEEYLEMVRNDLDKPQNLPTDGIVHEITSNACLFLESISEFVEIVANILIKKDISYKNSPDAADNRKVFSVYASRVLSTLGLNLRLKYEAYTDEALGAVFLINNFCYILKFLQKSSLLQIVCIATPKVEEYYNQQIQEFKRIYSQSWSKVIYYMSDKSGPVLHMSRSSLQQHHNVDSYRDSFKLKDKDKQAIKEKFVGQGRTPDSLRHRRPTIVPYFQLTLVIPIILLGFLGFNKEFEDICTNHARFSVPDPKIRETLLLETKAFILPLFQDFNNKYKNVPFSKNPEKYLKYDSEQVSSHIDHFFAGVD